MYVGVVVMVVNCGEQGCCPASSSDTAVGHRAACFISNMHDIRC